MPVADYRDQLGLQESQNLVRMAEKRWCEYSTGRHCAHQMLQAAAVPTGSASRYDIAIGQEREPCWPAGAKGSITHTEDIAAAVVCRDDACASLGLDIERVQSLEEGVLKIIAATDELQRIQSEIALGGETAALADTSACLAFSAKESVFKCLFPLYRHWLDFSQVRIRLSDVTYTGPQFLTGQFAAEFTDRNAVAIDLRQLRGQFMQMHGFIVTTTEI